MVSYVFMYLCIGYNIRQTSCAPKRGDWTPRFQQAASQNRPTPDMTDSSPPPLTAIF